MILKQVLRRRKTTMKLSEKETETHLIDSNENAVIRYTQNVNHKIICTFPFTKFPCILFAGLNDHSHLHNVIYEHHTINDQTILKSSLVRLVSGTLIRIKKETNVFLLFAPFFFALTDDFIK